MRISDWSSDVCSSDLETGDLQQSDIDKSIRLLRDRVGMPTLNVAAANANPDPWLAGQYTEVNGLNKGVILEIRRERRIELVMENFRWDDLMRWKEGHLLAEQFYGQDRKSTRLNSSH